ncbi:hypothetical protein [Burkholderia sp. BDU5]|uniref:hypothetical protein n=1 Tax=Burkholderia sp. BDU5 TaxID=1385590 RepID=UPI0018D21FB2|nr:hypothetical protein [Burkholderia sp. BDU5]
MPAVVGDVELLVDRVEPGFGARLRGRGEQDGRRRGEPADDGEKSVDSENLLHGVLLKTKASMVGRGLRADAASIVVEAGRPRAAHAHAPSCGDGVRYRDRDSSRKFTAGGETRRDKTRRDETAASLRSSGNRCARIDRRSPTLHRRVRSTVRDDRTARPARVAA